ncbi:uncharacterized protein [Lolium perenne]|uniref:uncharacterized protein n=1 Tax=Lolium perenne TaxID=4522 RepID=UPI0021F61D80|nr:uncharacterized protein LOC127310722 [Lolium perenne]
MDNVSGYTFRHHRRFHRHHRRNPPLLGFFVREGDFVPTLEAPNKVPPRRLSLQRGEGDRFLSLGCRHGLVLIFDIKPNQMLVCDPVTGDQHRLAIPPGIATHAENTTINGAVLRPAGAVDHFQVVLTVGDNDDKQHRRVLACVYSSETGLWGDLISTPPSFEVLRSGRPTLVCTGNPAVLVGRSLYWVLAGNLVEILEFDLEKQGLSVLQPPVHMLKEGFFSIMRAEGGGLGLLFPTYSGIQLWKRQTDSDGVASWALGRTIELDKLLPLNSRQVSVTILGLAEENNVVYLCACAMVFMVHLESLQFKKLCETNFLCHYHPFECVYATGIGGGHDAADLLHHS